MNRAERLTALAGVVVDLNRNEVRRGGIRIALSPVEAEMLFILRAADGASVSTKDVKRGLYGVLAETAADSIVRSSMAMARKKIAEAGLRIVNDFKVGYRLEVDTDR